MSQLTTNIVQLGQDQTNTANNFVLSAPGDGSFSISSGVPGNTASPVFEVTTAGTVLVASAVTTNTVTDTLVANTVTISDYTFPAADGNANQVFQTDGAGNISFTDLPQGFTTGKAIAMAIVFG